MKRLAGLGVGLWLVGLLLASLAVAADEGKRCPDTLVFPGKGKLGAVSFSPKIHEERGISCVLCHHTGPEDGKCSNCHGVDPSVPSSQDAYHLLCKGCHKHKKIDNSCEFCHRPEK